MFKRILINLALKVLKNELLDKINYAPVDQVLNVGYNAMKDLSGVLTDDDPNNAAQLSAWWQGNRTTVLVTALETVKNVADTEIGDQKVTGYIDELITSIEDEIKAGTLFKAA